jgi:hypothetical protein
MGTSALAGRESENINAVTDTGCITPDMVQVRYRVTLVANHCRAQPSFAGAVRPEVSGPTLRTKLGDCGGAPQGQLGQSNVVDP